MKSCFAALVLGIATLASNPLHAETLSVYHVGNSVTDTINYGGLDAMATARGHEHTWGRHMIPGAPLEYIWDHGKPHDHNGDGTLGYVDGATWGDNPPRPMKPEDGDEETAGSGFGEAPFGKYHEALPNHAWDVVTLQPFDRLIEGEKHARDMVGRFIDLTLTNPANADTQFYIYQRWPRRDEVDGQIQPLDYAAKWGREFTGGWEGTKNETADYFEKLLLVLREDYPALTKPILMVPVGDVLLELDKRMEAGEVPGFTDVEQIYSDGIHFTGEGAFVVGTTFYATLYGEDPAGLAVLAQYGAELAPDTVAAIQSAVWDVVSGHAYSGVAPAPEPTAAATAATLAAAALLRRP